MMALLYYENLGVKKPFPLIQGAVRGLKEFYDFLKITKQHLEQKECQIGWEPIIDSTDDEIHGGNWVRLVELPNSSDDEFERSLKLFMNQDVKFVYDTDTDKNTFYFSNKDKIKVLSRKEHELLIQLEKLPVHDLLSFRPNTYQIQCQMNAIYHLQDKPSKDLVPLLELFRPSKHSKWSNFEYDNAVDDDDWIFLTEEDRNGTSEQRKFVKIAMSTPDFAFLDGPPGSGKTTAICELIYQLAKQGKRILLCASTHVAVDNVLERLMQNDNIKHDILPVRIGDPSSVSEKASCWQFKNLAENEMHRIKQALMKQDNRSNSQEEFLILLQKGSETMERIILESANLVCGTTIGILQHPDIKNSKRKQSPMFDMIIIDEASKTTFQEFLVPAILAKQWVLVGDPKQLSPYVDDEQVAVNLAACLDKEYKRNACIDILQAVDTFNKRVTSLVIENNDEIVNFYNTQAKYYTNLPDQKEVWVGGRDTLDDDLPLTDLIVADYEYINSQEDNLPLDISHIRNPQLAPETLIRRIKAYNSICTEQGKNIESKEWETELAWRLAREYEQRHNFKISENSKKKSRREKLQANIQKLYPAQDINLDTLDDLDNKKVVPDPDVCEKIEIVRRIALPSILESLREGFGKNPYQKNTTLTDGLPSEALKLRLVRLTHQHRMHPDIADFPSNVIYQGKALNSDESMIIKRNWTYKPNLHVEWRDVQGKKSSNNANIKEVDEIFRELRDFDEWAKSNYDDQAWEVAVLSFYRGQEKALRNRMRKWTRQNQAYRNFHRGSENNRYMNIQVCTVDRFQGQEADLVLLSFANNHPTSFLESPNRLNVAITRARYRLVIYGNRTKFMNAYGVLGEFVNDNKWGTSV